MCSRSLVHLQHITCMILPVLSCGSPGVSDRSVVRMQRFKRRLLPHDSAVAAHPAAEHRVARLCYSPATSICEGLQPARVQGGDGQAAQPGGVVNAIAGRPRHQGSHRRASASAADGEDNLKTEVTAAAAAAPLLPPQAAQQTFRNVAAVLRCVSLPADRSPL